MNSPIAGCFRRPSKCWRAPRGCIAQLFEPVQRGGAAAVWEPPADLIETETDVVAILALPGVDPKDIVAVIEDNDLVVVGQRGVPAAASPRGDPSARAAAGPLRARLRLPPGHYGDVQRGYVHGCFVVTLTKVPNQGGARG